MVNPAGCNINASKNFPSHTSEPAYTTIRLANILEEAKKAKLGVISEGVLGSRNEKGAGANVVETKEDFKKYAKNSLLWKK